MKIIQLFTFILISILPLLGTAQNAALPQKNSDIPAQAEAQKKFWSDAYKAAEAYFAQPSPENAEKFFMALPDKQLPHLDADGELRLINFVFDNDGIGKARNFSILIKSMEKGEPEAVDLGFRLINISDGLAGEGLCYFLGRIVDKYPRLFLQKLLVHQSKTEPSVLELLDSILHPVAWWEQQNDEAGYPELLKKRLDIRIKALESVNDNDLKEIRDRCLTILKNRVPRS